MFGLNRVNQEKVNRLINKFKSKYKQSRGASGDSIFGLTANHQKQVEQLILKLQNDEKSSKEFWDHNVESETLDSDEYEQDDVDEDEPQSRYDDYEDDDDDDGLSMTDDELYEFNAKRQDNDDYNPYDICGEM